MREVGKIQVEKRSKTNSRLSKQLRQNGLIPGNVCGKGMESIPVAVKLDDLKKSIARYGRNSVFTLNVGNDEEYNIMVREIQYGPVRKEVLHVDFQLVSFTEEIKADINLRVLGREQVEMKKLILLQHVDVIPVIGFPQDIPEAIDADVSELADGDSLYVSDLVMPDGITADLEGDHLILSVTEAKIEVEDEESDDEEAALEAGEAEASEAEEEE